MVDEPNDEGFNELKSFISGSLKAIMEGISDAQSATKMSSAHGSRTFAYNAPTDVSFDIAVSAERSLSTQGGFFLKVLSAGAEANVVGEKANSAVTRIQFAVRTAHKDKNADRPISIPKTVISG